MYLIVNPIASLLSDRFMPGPKRGTRRAQRIAVLAGGKSRTIGTMKSVARSLGVKIYACDGFLEKDGVGRMISEKI